MLFPAVIGAAFEPPPCVSSPFLFPPSLSFFFSLTDRADPFLTTLVYNQQPVEDTPLFCVTNPFIPVISTVHAPDPGLGHALRFALRFRPQQSVPVFPHVNTPTLLTAPAYDNGALGRDGVAASVHNSYAVLDAAASRYTVPRSDRRVP